MGCAFSNFRGLVPSFNESQRVLEFNGRRFKVVSKLGEGGYAFVFLVQEIPNPLTPHNSLIEPSRHQYALKQVLAQSREQLELVQEEVLMTGHFNHPNIVKLLDSGITTIPASKNEDAHHQVHMLFPAYKDGSLQEVLAKTPPTRQCFSVPQVLGIFDQVCAAVEAMHAHQPPCAHWDIKPGNVLLQLDGVAPAEALPSRAPATTSSSPPTRSRKKEARSAEEARAAGGCAPHAALADFGSARRARVNVANRQQAMALMEEAEKFASAPYRAPELWDLPTHTQLDEKVDVWALGCLLYAIMYRESPFEFNLEETGGSLALAVLSGRIRWPEEGPLAYPDTLHQLVLFMLQADPVVRPNVSEVRGRIEAILRDSVAAPTGLAPARASLKSSAEVPFRDANGAAWDPFAEGAQTRV